MHLPSFLFVATTAASSLVSARVDRLPQAHREFARSENLQRREALPEPQPYRLFSKPDSAGASSPFVKRDDASFAKIGDAVGEVATALKLEMPPVVQLSAVNTTRVRKTKSHKKNQVCRKKTAEEKRKSRAEKEKKKKVVVAAAPKEQKLNVESNSHAAVSSKSSSSSSDKSSSDNKSSSSENKSQSSSSSVVNKVTGIVKPAVSLIGFHSDNCGPSDATDEFPNGSESWLNCGISKSNPESGWKPPSGVTLDHITTVTLEHALATNPVWEPCKPFVWLFEKIGAEEDLPPILLASFAMQESTCDPHVLGDNAGAFGLMQITEDKCSGMDAKGCSEPEYNVRTAARYFKKELSDRGGRFLEALGAYNGWQVGMSYKSGTAAQYGDCQNNLDYLHQFVNGWMTSKTGYEMGSFRNLAVCKD